MIHLNSINTSEDIYNDDESIVANPIKTVFVTNVNVFLAPMFFITLVFIPPVAGHTLAFYWLADYLNDLHDPNDSEAYVWLIAAIIIALGTTVFAGYLMDSFDYRLHEHYTKSAFWVLLIIIVSIPVLLVVIYYAQNDVLLGFLQA